MIFGIIIMSTLRRPRKAHTRLSAHKRTCIYVTTLSARLGIVNVFDFIDERSGNVKNYRDVEFIR